MSERIEVVIDRQLKVKYETKGIPGSACVEASDWLDQIFGSQNIIEEEKTSEFFHEKVALNTQTVGNG